MTRRHRALFILALVSVGAFLQLGSLSLVDYDEGCYAEVSREMYASGDLVMPRLGGEAFFEKPPLLYWLQVLGYRMFGVNEWGARFFNALAAVATVGALGAFAARALGPRAALISMFVLGTSFAFVATARVAVMDTALTLWIVLSLGCAWRAFEQDGGRWWLLGAAAAAGLAVLTKGAIGLLLPGGALLLYLARVGGLRRLFRPSWFLPAALLTLAVGCSWFVLLGLTAPDGFGFLRTLFWEHHVGRFLHPKQSHGGPFYYYLVVLLAGFLPWTPLLLPALGRQAPARAEAGRRLLLLFSIFAAISTVFYSIAATKLPNYVTPVYPALALLVGDVLDREPAAGWRSTKRGRWARRLTLGSVFLGAGVCLALPLVVGVLPRFADPRSLRDAPGLAHPLALGLAPYLMSASAVACGFLCLSRPARRSLRSLVVPLGGMALCLSLIVILWLQPRVDAHFLVPLRTVALRAAGPDAELEPVALVGLVYRPSALFYGGRATRYVAAGHPDRIATLFAGPGPHDAITCEVVLPQLREQGRVEEIVRDRGYVLVRCYPPPGSRTTLH